MTAREQAFDDWVERARAVTCRSELERRGLWHRKLLGDQGQPCPGCGGRDRFAVNLRKNLFICRAGGAGGDAIALVRHVDDCSFLTAVETLTGERCPAGEAEDAAARAERIARLEARQREQAAEARRLAEDGERFRRMEQRAAFDLWLEGKPIAGTAAEQYLALRGLRAPAEARLRFHPRLAYFAGGREYAGRDLASAPLFTGPALIAAIQAADGRFIGLHRTWLDLEQADGKAVVIGRDGEALPAKKVRGSKRGGTIRLAGHPADVRAPRPAWRVVMGEGIETTLSVHAVMTRAERAGTEFCAGVDLSNIAGKAKGRVPHPTESRPDKRGRGRRVFVGDDVPDPADETPLIGLPDGMTELVLLGDGDSERFRTELAMRRAAARYAEAYLGVTVKLAMAADGLDFNTMLRAA